MDISIVIGSYNQEKRIEKVILGFMDQVCTCKFEVVIVDSMSTDGTKALIESYLLKPLNFKLNFIQRDNSGKAEARNVGVKASNSELIIITDADMIPDSGLVQAHYTAHKNSKTVSCFEGLAYNLDTYDWPPKPLLKNTQVPSKYRNGNTLGWYYFLTGNLSFPKSIFDIEKGFSVDFKSYGWEDLELGYRLIEKRQIPLLYLTDAINYHYHVITDKEKVERKFNMGQSAQIFIKKHPELKTFLGLNPISVWLRNNISKNNIIYKFIKGLERSNISLLERFSYWFTGEYNYLTGLLNK